MKYILYLFLVPFTATLSRTVAAQTNTFPASGNVGIGTMAPSKKLDIAGSGINLQYTTAASQNGIIFKNGNRFIYEFKYGDNGTVITAGGNTFVGVNAGNFTMGSTATSASHASYNTGVGAAVLNRNTTGFQNTAVGYTSLEYNTTGYSNAAFGYEALVHNTTGSHNTATGYATLFNNTTGNNNTVTGNAALLGNHTGSTNIATGYQAGRYTANGSADNTASSSSVFIGANTKSLTTADNNEIVIGYNATGAGSNSAVLGNTSITKTLLQGNVLIGKTSQTNSSYKLDVNGNIRANKVMVNTSGADYVFDASYKLLPIDSLKSYIKINGHLPGILSAAEMQKYGLDVGNNQMKLQQKVEELTLYLLKAKQKEGFQHQQILKMQKQIEYLEKEFEKMKIKTKHD